MSIFPGTLQDIQPGGNTGTGVILRNETGDTWLINTAGEIQTIPDLATYRCLAASNPVIWNVSNEEITAWTPRNSNPVSCGQPLAIDSVRAEVTDDTLTFVVEARSPYPIGDPQNPYDYTQMSVTAFCHDTDQQLRWNMSTLGFYLASGSPNDGTFTSVHTLDPSTIPPNLSCWVVYADIITPDVIFVQYGELRTYSDPSTWTDPFGAHFTLPSTQVQTIQTSQRP